MFSRTSRWGLNRCIDVASLTILSNTHHVERAISQKPPDIIGWRGYSLVVGKYQLTLL